MRLTVFGASSATGKLLVEKALAKGYEVTAFVRDESKLGITNPNLQVACGDALSPEQVEQAIKECNAVLSTLGPRGKPTVMAAQSTKHIVDAMQKYGVRRLVVVSVAGVPVPQDQRKKNLVDDLIKNLLKEAFADRQNQLAILEASTVDWVAVRVPRLTDEAAKGTVRAFFGNLSPTSKVSRADLADFMLDQLINDQWLRQAPMLSN